MTYTVNWFEITGKANFEEYLARFKGQPFLKFLEIGCFEGMATRWMLDNILTNPSSEITVVDTFEGSAEHKGNDNLKLATLMDRFEENVIDVTTSGKVLIHKGMSKVMLRPLQFEYYDFIYVDGSHHADDALQDLCLSWDLLKPGGLMICDDYAWNNHPDRLNACIAMDAFLACFEGRYELLKKEYQLVLVKKEAV